MVIDSAIGYDVLAWAPYRCRVDERVYSGGGNARMRREPPLSPHHRPDGDLCNARAAAALVARDRVRI